MQRRLEENEVLTRAVIPPLTASEGAITASFLCSPIYAKESDVIDLFMTIMRAQRALLHGNIAARGDDLCEKQHEVTISRAAGNEDNDLGVKVFLMSAPTSTHLLITNHLQSSARRSQC